MSAVTIIPRSLPKPAGYTLAHHVGSPPTAFKNPWPSAGNRSQSLTEMLRIRFFNSKNKNHVPVPADRKGLPKILTPDWGHGKPDSKSALKATWIGHASFLVEMPTTPRNVSHTDSRGIRILFDPVFSSNMSPFSFGGPKRISAPPCPIEDLPEIDLVLISHDHYDHLDITTIKFINERGAGRVRYMCGLGVKKHLVEMGVDPAHVVETDWWDSHVVEVEGLGKVTVVCTPSQHFSGRWWNDHGNTLWCSWVLLDGDSESQPQSDSQPESNSGPKESPIPERKSLFFAGDTGYRYKPQDTNVEEHDQLPGCPAFSQIGLLHGPFSLALLPIGCYAPRSVMSHIHCAPEDSILIHKDVRSKKSYGMHFGTVRGNISEHYEDATEPAELWRRECEKAGLRWGEEICVADIGGTVFV